MQAARKSVEAQLTAALTWKYYRRGGRIQLRESITHVDADVDIEVIATHTPHDVPVSDLDLMDL